MSDTDSTRRRRVLQGVGAAGAVLLAGCSGSNSDDNGDNTSNDNTSNGNTSNGNTSNGNTSDSDTGNGTQSGQYEVAIQPAIDTQAIRRLQVQLQGGQLNRSEFIQQRDQLFQDSVDNLTARVENTSSVTVAETRPDVPAVRATGDADALVELLETREAQALASVSELQQQTPGSENSTNDSS